MPKATTKRATTPKPAKRVRVAAPIAPQSSDLDLYAVRLVIAGETYESQGDTIVDALDGIRPQFIKSYGFFTITHGKLTAQRRMFPLEIKKLLKDRLTRQIFDKRMNLFLK